MYFEQPIEYAELGGLFKKIKKGLKKAFTPPKQVKAVWNKAVAAPIKRLSKMNTAEFIKKGGLWGVVDPKMGKFHEKYGAQFATEALKLLPGVGPIASGLYQTATDMATAAGQGGGEIPFLMDEQAPLDFNEMAKPMPPDASEQYTRYSKPSSAATPDEAGINPLLIGALVVGGLFAAKKAKLL